MRPCADCVVVLIALHRNLRQWAGRSFSQWHVYSRSALIIMVCTFLGDGPGRVTQKGQRHLLVSYLVFWTQSTTRDYIRALKKINPSLSYSAHKSLDIAHIALCSYSCRFAVHEGLYILRSSSSRSPLHETLSTLRCVLLYRSPVYETLRILRCLLIDLLSVRYCRPGSSVLEMSCILCCVPTALDRVSSRPSRQSTFVRRGPLNPCRETYNRFFVSVCVSVQAPILEEALKA